MPSFLSRGAPPPVPRWVARSEPDSKSPPVKAEPISQTVAVKKSKPGITVSEASWTGESIEELVGFLSDDPPRATPIRDEPASSRRRPTDVPSPAQQPQPNGQLLPPVTAETSDEDASFAESDDDRSTMAVDTIITEMLQREGGLKLPTVIESVHQFFPLVRSAYLERNVASGNQLAAQGGFDDKWKGNSISQPLGFYENYRQSLGVTRPIYQGGEWFTGYKVGQGSFQPWYQERPTNEGGEFRASVLMPLMRNREIDARRAELWRANYDRQIVEPEIRSQLIMFVRDASHAYWTWVAAGEQVLIGRTALELAQQRARRLAARVEKGDLDPPILTDNERAIASRRADLTRREQKFVQSAVKLSIYLQDGSSEPFVPQIDSLPSLPDAVPMAGADEADVEVDQVIDRWIDVASRNRPELQAIDLMRRRLGVDHAEARNDLQPNLDLELIGSQDTGEPTSSLEDKSEFEIEIGVYLEVPMQRRKAKGKLRALHAKIAQIDAKRQMAAGKIGVDVRNALAAIEGTYQTVKQNERAVELAEELASIERRKFALGESDLLMVFLREQYAIEAADKVILSLLDYHRAVADFNAAIGEVRGGDETIVTSIVGGPGNVDNPDRVADPGIANAPEATEN